MGDPFDLDRGLGPGSRGFGVPEPTDPNLQLTLSSIAGSSSTTHRDQAIEDARQRRDLWNMIISQRWASDRERRLYTRHHLVARETEAGRPTPSSDQLYHMLLDVEKQYAAYQKSLTEEREREQAIAMTRATAAAGPMNPLEDFEPGRFDVLLTTARRDTRWVEDNIKEAKGRIDRQSGAHTLIVSYKDGNTLDIPLHPKPAMFRKPLKETEAIRPFFRRHKRSGRVVPFQISYADFAKLAPSNAPIEEAFNAVPPRFDPELTPHMMTLRDLADSSQLYNQFVVLQQGYGAVATATAFTNIKPTDLARVTEKTAGAATSVAVQTGRLAQAGLSEVRFAVAAYGPTVKALAYLGRSGYSFYLRHAVAINTGAIVGTEIALTFAGEDMGPVSPGDSIHFAVEGGDAIWRAYKAEVTYFDDVADVARAEIATVNKIDPKTAETTFDSGSLAHHERAALPAVSATPIDPPLAVKPPVLPSSKADDALTAAKAVDEKVDDAAKATAGKGTNPETTSTADNGIVPATKRPPKTPSPAKGPYNINHIELLSDADIETLVKIGVDRAALEKLKSIPIGELERMGLKAKDVAGLRKKIRASKAHGGVVVDFINGFYQNAGFEFVVLNWSKGGNARAGTNFVMKYALRNFKGEAIKFEWPLAYAVTHTGQEAGMAARYVDIVVDGGTKLRPGEALRIELKSWTSRYLATTKVPKAIAKQLVRDTAFFGKDNIHWVFNASKATEADVIRAMTQAIREDPYLKTQWVGTDEEIAAAVSRLVDMFKP